MNKKHTLLLLALTVLSILITFSINGIYNDKVDTQDYVEQIVQVQEGTFFNPDFVISNRVFKPLYGVLGAGISSLGASHYLSILIINILFLFGLVISTYFFLKLLDFNTKLSLWGASWVAFAYPVLKYGIALGTDISGWFFALISIVFSLKFFKTKQYRYLIIASILGFLGALTKETGLIGLIFTGLYILFQFNNWSFRDIIKSLTYLSLPFLVLELSFLYYLHKLNIPSFFSWYGENIENNINSYYKLHYFIGVEGSAFNMILPLSLLGVYLAWEKRELFTRNFLSIYLSLLLSSSIVLLWPIFITRVLFIQFIFFIPLAVYGISKLPKDIVGTKKYYTVLLLPILISILLFSISHDQSLFDLLSNSL